MRWNQAENRVSIIDIFEIPDTENQFVNRFLNHRKRNSRKELPGPVYLENVR